MDKKLIESLLQLIVTFLILLFALSVLESCEAEGMYIREKAEHKSFLHLYPLNLAGEGDINIVFLPEGYTSEQMDDFVSEANIAWGILQQTKPYSHSLDRINVYYSTDLASATDSLGSGHTAFALGMPKPLQASCKISVDSIVHTMSQLPFSAEKTVFVIMVNVGGNNQLGFTLLSKPVPGSDLPETVVIRSLFDRYPAAFTHEMGHAVGLLADEYYHQSEDFTFDDKERQELIDWQEDGLFLNVSLFSCESEVFWSQFIVDEAFAEEHIGIFEGGYYSPRGVYRSTFNSVMRHHFQSDFYNAVDRYLVYRRIEKIHSGRDISYEEWRQIDLAHPQPPIDWHSLTGGITRSVVTDSIDVQLANDSDVIVIK